MKVPSNYQTRLFLCYPGDMKRAILLVDHGSRREEANIMLLKVRDLVRSLCPEETVVHYAHMELAHPTIEQGVAACVDDGAKEIIVHPYMLAPGRHAAEDIPRMAKEAAGAFQGVKVRVAEPLGIHINLAEVVLERCGVKL